MKRHVTRRAKILKTAAGNDYKCMASWNKRAMALEGGRVESRRGEKVEGRVSTFQAGVHMDKGHFLRAQQKLNHLRKMARTGGTSCASVQYFLNQIERYLKVKASMSEYLRTRK